MNTTYIIGAYPVRNPHLTDKDIREAAFPIQMVLQTLRYVVKHHEKLDPDFVMPKDDKITIWIDKLERARNSALDQKKGDVNKYIRSVDRMTFEVMGKFFEQRESVYLIYSIFIFLQNIIQKGKWFIPYRAEKYFYEVYAQIAEYMESEHSEIINGAERSATKIAAKINKWMNERGMYQ